MTRGIRVLSGLLAGAMGVVLASSLVSGAAFADVAYTAGAPAVQVQGVQSLDVQAKVKKGWKSTAAGKAYYRNGSPVVGLQKIGGAYYYFNSKGILRQTDVKVADAVFYVGKGGKIFGAKRNGQCYYGTLKAMTSSDAFDFETFIWARSIVASISSSSDSDSAKLWKAFNWVKNKSYAIHQNFDPRQTNWPAIYARHHFNNSGGDCHADGAAFAYLAAAIGYPADVCIDSWGTGYAPSHCWAMIGNAVYDPLFYESKSTMYYGATSGTYETSPTARFRVPQYNPSNNSGGEVSQALLNAGALGLKKVNGAYCYYVNGKKVKSTWKTIDGKRYYFKKNGAAATLSTKVDGAYYVFDKKGVLQRSAKAGERIVTIGKESYQVHKSGKAAAGWSKGKKRYAKSNGLILKKTWKNIDGKRYYFAKDGVRVTRSAKVEGSYYVFDVDGALLKGEKGSPTALVEVGKNTYRVDSEGKAVAGWSDDGTQRFDKTGLLLKGVRYLGGAFYAANENGVYLPNETAHLNEAINGFATGKKSAIELRRALNAAGAKLKQELYSASCDKGIDFDGLWEYDTFVIMTARSKSVKALYDKAGYKSVNDAIAALDAAAQAAEGSSEDGQPAQPGDDGMGSSGGEDAAGEGSNAQPEAPSDLIGADGTFEYIRSITSL